MLTRKDYNSDTYSDFLKNSDYDGAINYLSQFRLDNIDDQQGINAAILDLKKKRDRLNYVMNNPNINDMTKNAVRFMDGWKNGADLTKYENAPIIGNFLNRFNATIDKMTNSPIIFDNDIHKNYFLGIDWLNSDDPKPESGWDLFKHNLGISKDKDKETKELQNYGITAEYDEDGKVKMKFINTGDINKSIKVMSALFNTDTNHSIANGLDPIDPENKSKTYRWQPSTEHAFSNFLTESIDYIQNGGNSEAFIEELKKTQGNKLTDEQWHDLQEAVEAGSMNPIINAGGMALQGTLGTIGGLAEWFVHSIGKTFNGTLESELDNVLSIYENAENTYNQFMNRENSDVVTGEIQAIPNTPLMDYAELRRMYGNKEITDGMYSKKLEELNNYVLSKLKTDTGGYLNNEIYAINEEATSDDDMFILSKVTDDKEKNRIIQQISFNANNGYINPETDVSYAISPTGDGLLVTIGGNKEAGSKNGVVLDYTKDKRRQYFIKGFADTKYTEEYRNSTDYKAIQALNECRLYGQPMDVSRKEGEHAYIQPVVVNGVMDSNTLEYVTQTENGKQESRIISRTDALRELNRKEIIKSAVDKAVYSSYNSDGKYVGNPNLDLQIRRIAEASMLELYPTEMQLLQVGPSLGYNIEPTKSFIQQMVEEMVNQIYSEINYKVDNDENK